jgi:LysR family transcriptional activator of mexEF-oprN operon
MNRMHSAALDLNLLKLFDAVMQTRSVSRAATLLGLSQSAVSHGLARLREATGDPLFIRSAGGMEPTARAQRLAEPMREALALAAEALSPDGARPFDPGAGRRVFTIGAGDYAATVLLGGFLAELAAAGWDIGIAVLPVDRNSAPAMLDAGRIDLALGLLPQQRRWHESRVLYEEVQACVFDGARLGIAAPISLDGFCALPQIVPSLHGDFTTWVEEELEQLGRTRRVVMATAHFLSIPMLLKQVPAVATLPRRLCMACANAAALTVSPLPFPPRRFEISMLWHRRDSNAAAQVWLRERIAAHNRPTDA